MTMSTKIDFGLFEGHVSFLNRDSDVLRKLAVDARDPSALVALYDMHGKKIRRAATRWFGRQPEICNRAVNNILVSIGKKAATYDPKSVDAADWIHQCADAEARRLSEALEASASKSPRNRRAL